MIKLYLITWGFLLIFMGIGGVAEIVTIPGTQVFSGFCSGACAGYGVSTIAEGFKWKNN